MQHMEVSGAVRHIYTYVIKRLKVKRLDSQNALLNSISCIPNRKFERVILKHDLFLFSSYSEPGEVNTCVFSIIIMLDRY